MKNTSSVMLGIVDGIFQDITSYLPDLQKELKTVLKVMSSAIKDRGLPFFTITLPDCVKFLEHALEEGELSVERPPYHGRYDSSDDRPMFLHGLWVRIFDEQGRLLGDPCHFSISALRQVYLLAKKWEMDCDRDYVDQAVKDYLRIESELPRPRPGTWDCDNPEWSRPDGHPLWGLPSSLDDIRQYRFSGFDQPEARVKSSTWALFRELCSRLSVSLGELDAWAIRPKHGPGAVSDQQKGSVKYDFLNWPKKLDAVFPFDYFASSSLTDRRITEREVSCKLIAVPKTQKGPRLIASEPTAHQWIQGGIQRWFEEAISRTPLGLSIDFTDQGYSRALALESSGTRAYATVDLSSASDRLSARLVEYVFQANFSLLDALHACRSRSVVIPADLHPERRQETLLLRKFAAQGSAETFPVQTVIFTIIGHLALMLADNTRDCSLPALRRRAHRLRVFGDDIIIDNKAYDHLVVLLTECGLKVNDKKSYHKGYFREACGMDAYNGTDVSCAYLRTFFDPSVPESLESVVETANNFYKRGWWWASHKILKTVDPGMLACMPVSNLGFGSASLFTYQQGTVYPTRRRYNRELHRYEYLGLVCNSNASKLRGNGESSLLQYFIEDPSRQQLWGPDEPQSRWSVGQAKRPALRIKRRWVATEA